MIAPQSQLSFWRYFDAKKAEMHTRLLYTPNITQPEKDNFSIILLLFYT